jgi:hypothetical protein
MTANWVNVLLKWRSSKIPGMFASALVYLGLIGAFLGFVSLIVPSKPLHVRTRRRALLLLASGFFLLAIGFAFPAAETKVAEKRTQLDEFTPVYQFDEVHSTRVKGSKDRIYLAIKSVTADEIFLFRTLTWIRRLGHSGGEGILNPPEHQPLLDVALRTGFILLADQPGREIVLGNVVVAPPGFRPRAGQSMPTPEQFKAIRQPGFAMTTMNFLIEDTGDGYCTVHTETRVYATDSSARRRFTLYWRMIYPGTALIRRMWLRAIKNHAEASSKGLR